MGAVTESAHSDDPSGRDDATIPPGGDADRTMPGPGGDDRTMPAGAAPSAPAPFATRGDRMPDRVGDCRVEKRLGTGGFGDVLLAVQESDLLKRRVAIKLLKRGMDSEAVLERFRVERKVLDTLNHPNIARLLGGGETDDGRSYLMMEFVDGLTLDLWCERQALDLPGRLRLLKQVASALAHAHEKGIVHRDLKPANVLVGSDGVPKLLDFGIAKIIAPGVSESERSHLTLPGETGPLTTAYASPEQLRGEPLSAATDIYSFGVMMYEVLSGRLPFDFSKSSFDEIRRRVCEQTPTLPSAAAGGGAKTTVDPKTTSGSMRRSLRGDVDNIVMMAMRKEPTRRYASMTALIADIDAYLEDRPVLARPSSVGYRLSKSITRNRWRVALAAALSLSVLVAGGWWELGRRQAERRYAETMQRVKEFRNDENFHLDTSRALAELAEAETLAEARVRARPGDADGRRDLLLILTKQCDVYENTRDLKAGLGASARLVELARSLRKETGSFDDRQNLEQALQKRGDLLLKTGDIQQARAVFEESLAERRQMSSEKPDDVGLMQSMSVALQRMRECALQVADLESAVRFDRDLKEVRGRVMRAMRPAQSTSGDVAAGKNAKQTKEAKERDKAERQWMLAMIFLASDLLSLDRLPEAEPEAVAARDIAQARLERDRKDWRRSDDLAMVEEVLFLVAYQRADMDAAQAGVDRWVSRTRAAVEASSASSVALRGLVASSVEQARVRNDLGRHAEALEGITALLDSLERYRAGRGAEAKGEAISAEAALMAQAQRMRALRGLGRQQEARALVSEIQAKIAAPNEGVIWHLGCSEAAREASRCVEDPALRLRLAQQSVESSKKSGDRIVMADAQFALHEALKAAGKPEAADALAAAKAAAASSDTPRARAMLAQMQPPAPKPAAAKPPAPPAAAPAPVSAPAPPAAGKTP